MSSRPISVPEAPQATWTPMIIIVLAQIMMIFNISTLQVSMDAIATSFEASATTVGTAIVTYALVVAALILPAARMAQRLGSRRLFRGAVLLFGAGMILMSVSPGVTIMILAQIVCGLAAAALVPTLVVLVADNYAGEQQAKALGWLGGAPAMGIVLAFLLAGLLTSWIGWRFMFALVAALAGAVFHLSNRLSAARKPSDVAIDWIGAVLAGLAILFISVGANNLTNWGVLLAKSDAPFSLLDMSPAPLMILADVFLVQAFVSWSRRRDARGAQALVALEVVGAAPERAALFSIFIISAIASAATFLIPLYVQVVQGRSSFDTALTVIPFSVASFIAAVLVVRLYGRASPAQIGRYSFLLVAAGLALLGATIRNDWSNWMVVLGMTTAGLGEGALVTLLFNVLVTASPTKLAADVGSVRGATNNLATAVGTALAAALLISLLDRSVHYELVHNADLPAEVKSDLGLDDVAFVSNDRLREALSQTSASPEDVNTAVQINTHARLLALKITFFAFAGFALLAYFPAGALPRYAPKELPGAAPDLAPGEPSPASSPA
ncbi:MAG TPA: MFS transporter [Steroidobacter sp.]|nr:MFS transporter [Steroidobacter sp.]